jgi:hypothetical protein
MSYYDTISDSIVRQLQTMAMFQPGLYSGYRHIICIVDTSDYGK